MGLFGLIARAAAIPVQLVEIPIRAIEEFTAPPGQKRQEFADVLLRARREMIDTAAELDDE